MIPKKSGCIYWRQAYHTMTWILTQRPLFKQILHDHASWLLLRSASSPPTTTVCLCLIQQKLQRLEKAPERPWPWGKRCFPKRRRRLWLSKAMLRNSAQLYVQPCCDHLVRTKQPFDRSPRSHSTPDALHAERSHGNHILSVSPTIPRRSVRHVAIQSCWTGASGRAQSPHGPIAQSRRPARLLVQHRHADSETLRLLQHQTPLNHLLHHQSLQWIHRQRPERRPRSRRLCEAQVHA